MKIAFLAPRFHTNQISIIKYLLKSKKQVSFYVTRISQIEDHSVLKPIVIDLKMSQELQKIIFMMKQQISCQHLMRVVVQDQD